MLMKTYIVKWRLEYLIVGKMEAASERLDIKTVICDLALFWLSEVMLTLRLEMQPLSKHKPKLKVIILKFAFSGAPLCFLQVEKHEYSIFRRMRKTFYFPFF